MNSERLMHMIDSAIALAEERMANQQSGKVDPLSHDQLRSLLSALNDYKNQVSRGDLETSKGGEVRLGLLRAIIDWGEPLGTPLRRTLFDIENFYAKN
jgi:hypothetical protein